DDVQAEGDVHEIGEQGSQGDQLTVGEVGQPGGAVDERQAERRQGDDQPQVEPFEGELRGALPERAAAASFGGAAVPSSALVVRANRTVVGLPAYTVGVRSLLSPLTATSGGSVEVSRVTLYLPGSSIGTSHVPWALLVTS